MIRFIPQLGRLLVVLLPQKWRILNVSSWHLNVPQAITCHCFSEYVKPGCQHFFSLCQIDYSILKWAFFFISPVDSTTFYGNILRCLWVPKVTTEFSANLEKSSWEGRKKDHFVWKMVTLQAIWRHREKTIFRAIFRLLKKKEKVLTPIYKSEK